MKRLILIPLLIAHVERPRNRAAPALPKHCLWLLKPTASSHSIVAPSMVGVPSYSAASHGERGCLSPDPLLPRLPRLPSRATLPHAGVNKWQCCKARSPPRARPRLLPHHHTSPAVLPPYHARAHLFLHGHLQHVQPFETVVFYHCFFVSKPICYLQWNTPRSFLYIADYFIFKLTSDK
jgi:hypothetical protein